MHRACQCEALGGVCGYVVRSQDDTVWEWGVLFVGALTELSESHRHPLLENMEVSKETNESLGLGET